jgi:DNA modification methylase
LWPKMDMHNIWCMTHGMQLTQESHSISHVLPSLDYGAIQVQTPSFSPRKDEVLPLKNELHIGDNLAVLQDKIRDESVDLVYLDPPFNSKRNYNVIFRERSGKRSSSQGLVFEDTWEWNPKAEDTCKTLVEEGGQLSKLITAFRAFLGHSDMMAYIAMMAPRLRELHRVLKSTGSIYLHCDPTASHYLKMLMDAIFGPESFKNEIIWKRSHAHSDSKQGRKAYGNVTDVLLYYTKSENYTFNTLYLPYDQAYVDKYYRYRDPDGRRYWLDNLTGPGGADKGNPFYEVMGVSRYWRYSKEKMAQLIKDGRVVQNKPGNVPQYKRYLDEMPGLPLQNLWTDVDPINMMAKERTGYATQKPLALLKRIIEVSSNFGDVVMDPFCGCGTAIEASEEMGRHWIGIDVTHLAAAIIKQRLIRFGMAVFKKMILEGEPINIDEALALAANDKFGFQCWAVGRLGAPPIEHRKGADRGIDGRIYFHDDFGAAKEIIISVKAGENIGPAFVRELRGVVDREKAAMGIMVCVKPPTAEMRREASHTGFYKSLSRDFPKLQIITVEDIFDDKPLNIPGRLDPYAKKPAVGVKSQVRPRYEQLRLLP